MSIDPHMAPAVYPLAQISVSPRRRATYLSADSTNTCHAVFFAAGHGVELHHAPRWQDILAEGPLVVDFDLLPDWDKDPVAIAIGEAAAAGRLVGLHTYYPDNPRLAPASRPGVLWDRHCDLLLGRLLARKWPKRSAA